MDRYEQLAGLLRAANPQISEAKARTWVELLWEDFESTYAKAGYDYQGVDMAERFVKNIISMYGGKLHDFAAMNPRYAHLLESKDGKIH